MWGKGGVDPFILNVKSVRVTLPAVKELRLNIE